MQTIQQNYLNIQHPSWIYNTRVKLKQCIFLIIASFIIFHYTWKHNQHFKLFIKIKGEQIGGNCKERKVNGGERISFCLGSHFYMDRQQLRVTLSLSQFTPLLLPKGKIINYVIGQLGRRDWICIVQPFPLWDQPTAQDICSLSALSHTLSWIKLALCRGKSVVIQHCQ